MSKFDLDLFQVDYVVYHQGCMDGLTAAAAFKRYDNAIRFGDGQIIFIPMRAGDLPTTVKNITHKVIVFVDCSPPSMEDYEKLSESNKVFIVDHHHSANEIFGQLHNGRILIDETHSGAYLAWKLVKSKGITETLDESRFILLIEDNDIQACRLLPDSRYLSNALQIELNNIDESLQDKLDVLEHNMKNRLNDLITKGKEIQKEIDLYVDSVVKKGHLLQTGEYNIYMMEAEHWGHSTDIGRAALELDEVDISILKYPGTTSDGKEMQKLSLRSNKIDVGKLAHFINKGGGHKRAAGCDVPGDFNILNAMRQYNEYVKETN